MSKVKAAPAPKPEPKDTSVSRFNSLRTGLRSRYAVLPWENREEYEALLAAMTEHHAPLGPTEEHLVEELAGIVWRKQRLQQAEGALYRKELAGDVHDTYQSERIVQAAVIGNGASLSLPHTSLVEMLTPDESPETLAQEVADLPTVLRVSAALEAGESYAKALAALPPSWRDDWKENYLGQAYEDDDGEEKPYEATAEGLQLYVEESLLPYLRKMAVRQRHQPAIAAQLYGQACNPTKLELLARYETHLDRKLERMLAMLIKLQELRGTAGTP